MSNLITTRTWGHVSSIRLASLKNSRRENHMMSAAALQCKNDIGYEVMPLRPDQMLEGPLRVTIEQRCRRPLTSGRSPYRHFALGSPCFFDPQTGGLPRWCTDSDNAVCMLFDSLQGLVYEDDAMIAAHSATRIWAEADGFTVTVEEI